MRTGWHITYGVGVLGRKSLVGICVERSLEMVVGLLGILKAGGAYVPLDPAYPAERLAYMIADSRLPVLLTQQHLAELLPPHDAQVIYLDGDREAVALDSSEKPAARVEADNVAYMIYTSGSTGEPKGVQISHRAVINLLDSMSQRPGLTSSDVLLAVTTLSFDIAGLEIFLPLSVGARLVIVSRETAADAALLRRSLTESGATVMQATPATWRMLQESGWEGSAELKIWCGGEAMAPELAHQLGERASAVWNLYGPTETTIWSSSYQVGQGARQPANQAGIRYRLVGR